MYLQPQKMGKKDYRLGGYPAIQLHSYKLFMSCFSHRSKWISQVIKICAITIKDYCRTIQYQLVIDNNQRIIIVILIDKFTLGKTLLVILRVLWYIYQGSGSGKVRWNILSIWIMK
jgi:hypothetical protein